jgi:hypothetical protein
MTCIVQKAVPWFKQLVDDDDDHHHDHDDVNGMRLHI